MTLILIWVIRQRQRRNSSVCSLSRLDSDLFCLEKKGRTLTGGIETSQNKHEETVDHIVSGCEVLAKTEYIFRRNNAAAYLHWSIYKDHDIEITDKWYQHAPETVMHNKGNNITIMWDMPVNTDRTITANRPDIIVKDSVNSTCKLIDMTVPSDRNIALKEIEKKSKYKDLELEIQRMWHMKTIVIPVVIGVRAHSDLGGR